MGVKLRAVVCVSIGVTIMSAVLGGHPQSGASPARDELLIFNPNVDSRQGETSEFSTLSSIATRLQSPSGPARLRLIGLGEAFPFTSNSDRTAHEVFVSDDGQVRTA
jgi:hypothetical protein